METWLWGGVLRFAQATIAAAPTIVIGLLITGVFRKMLGYDGTRKLFGVGTWRSLPQAWAIGMLLPVCSLGVIPIAREMKKAGIPGGTILAFALTAPLFNPISVLYGLTLSDPVVIFTFSACALLIVTLTGIAWDRFFSRPESPEFEPEAPQVGIKRLIAVFAYASRELVGPSLLFIVLGLIGVAILSLILPFAYLQTSAEADDFFAPLFMASIAIPAYATPMTAMVQLATMFQHGNSVGAAFTLLILGAGTNNGLIAWTVAGFGWKRVIGWWILLFGIVIGLAYGVNQPLYPTGVQPAGHTHAFDIYCHPFAAGVKVDAQAEVFKRIQEETASFELIGLVGLACFLISGLGLSLIDRSRKLEVWTESGEKASSKVEESHKRRSFDVVLPGPVVGGVAIVGLVALSIYGCYIYYPAPGESFAEMRELNIEVVSAANTGEWEAAARGIPIYEDWSRKLQVGLVIRGGALTPFRQAKADVLRDKLELLEHEVEDKSFESSRKLAMQVNQAYLRLRRTYELSEDQSNVNQ